MKQDLKDHSPPNRSSAWLTLVVLLTLGFSAAAYTEVHRNITAGQQDQEMLVQINEIAHLHVMLAQLGKGQLESVRDQLKIKLAEELADVRPVATTEGSEPARYARTLLVTMDRYEKAHPDYYQTAFASPASGKHPAVPSASQMAASHVTAH